MVKHTKVKIVDNKVQFVRTKVKGPGLLCLLGLHRMRVRQDHGVLQDEQRQTFRIFRLGNVASMEVIFRCTRENCDKQEAHFFEIIES